MLGGWVVPKTAQRYAFSLRGKAKLITFHSICWENVFFDKMAGVCSENGSVTTQPIQFDCSNIFAWQKPGLRKNAHLKCLKIRDLYLYSLGFVRLS